MTAWATAAELRERMDAAWQLYADACAERDRHTERMAKFIAQRQCESALKAWKRLHDRHSRAVDREHKRRLNGGA